MAAEAEEFKLPEGIKDPAAEFDLQDPLGKGSFGSVYKAIYKKSGHEVAIKEVIVNEDFMEILKEINIMEQCKSRYVVQYYGNYFKGDNCWIVMEYCAYGSVGDLLNLTEHPLSEPHIAHICRSTLKGLSYLHRSNKIHRDIKPGNILVTGKGECKLADFGVSGTLSERTRKRNTVIGTPFFLAPEVIQEVGYDSKADIWALGITAIEMAEQNPPYHDVHPMRVLFLIPTNPPPTLKSPSSWSPEFSDFLRCCLNKDPSKRLSAKQLLKHPFVLKAKSTSIMRPLIDEAQVVIDNAGGRLQALKEISNRKAMAAAEHKEKGEGDSENEDEDEDDNEKESESESESDSSEDEKPQKKPLQINTNPSPISTSSSSSFTSTSNAQAKPNNQASILELDSILSGILSKSGGVSSPAAQPHSPSHPSVQPHSPSTAPPAAPSTPKAKATPEEELDALLTGLQARAKISAQAKPPGSPGPSRPPPSTSPTPTNPRLSTSFAASPLLPVNPPASPTPQRLATNSTPAQPAQRAPPSPSTQRAPPSPSAQRSAGSPSSSRASASSAASAERSLSASGNWDQFNCGGCSNSPDWRKNPQYMFKVTSPSITTAKVILMQNFGVKQTLVPIGFYVVKGGKGALQGRKVLSLGKDYSVEYIGEQTNFQLSKSVAATVKVEPGEYVVIPCTFTPGLEASFELEVTANPGQASSERLELSPLPLSPSGAWVDTRVSLAWQGPSAAGSYSTASSTWRDNPRVVLVTEKANTVTLVLARGESASASVFCGFYIFKSSDAHTPTLSLIATNLVAKTTFLNGSEVVLTVDLAAGKYVVLPCTYDANQEGPFTLSAYSKLPVKLITNDEHCIVERGGWSVSKGNAGGCLNHPTWRASPQYLITTKAPTRVHILLEQAGPDTSTLPFIGVYVLKQNSPTPMKRTFLLTPKDVVGNTEFMNDLQVVLSVDLEGSNIILPSTFAPQTEGLFTIRVSCSTSSEIPTIKQIPPWPITTASGVWKGPAAGGRYTAASAGWKNNPRFVLSPVTPSPEPIQFSVVLVQSEKPAPLGIGFYIFKKVPDNSLNNVMGKSGFVSGREVAMECTLPPGDSAVILPSTFEAGQEDTFTLTVYSSKECTLSLLSV